MFLFESSVILDGYKTKRRTCSNTERFESSVILDGYKTIPLVYIVLKWFESSVILDGYKTDFKHDEWDKVV